MHLYLQNSVTPEVTRFPGAVNTHCSSNCDRKMGPTQEGPVESVESEKRNFADGEIRVEPRQGKEVIRGNRNVAVKPMRETKRERRTGGVIGSVRGGSGNGLDGVVAWRNREGVNTVGGVEGGREVGGGIAHSKPIKDLNRSVEIAEDARWSGIAARIKLAKKFPGRISPAHFKDKVGQVKVKNTFPLVKSWTKSEGGVKKGWGKTILNVRAALEEAASFFWDFDSRAHDNITADVEREVLEEETGEFEQVVRRRHSVSGMLPGHDSFEFIYKMSLYVIGDDQIVIIGEAADSAEESKDYERGSEGFAMKLLRRGKLETKVVYVTELGLSDEAGSDSSKAALRSLQSLIEQRLDELTRMKMFFQYRVEVADMTEKDGEALGHKMIWHGTQTKTRHSTMRSAGSGVQHRTEEQIAKIKMETLRAVRSTGIFHDITGEQKRVEEVFGKSKALSLVKTKYPWIVVLVQRVRRGAVAVNHPMSKTLNCVNEVDARILGNNLMPALKTNKTVAAGIDQWRGQNRAVDELLTEYPWMSGLFAGLGQDVVNAAPWGLKWR